MPSSSKMSNCFAYDLPVYHHYYLNNIEWFCILVNHTIIIKNGDFHDGSPAQLDVFAIDTGDQGELYEKLLVRLPLVVINNSDTNLKCKKFFNKINLIL